MKLRADQPEIRDRLQALTDENGGRLTPQAVVEDAKDTSSPLHEFFTWDRDKAAYAYWLDQARALIRTVEVTFRSDTTVIRAPYFVRDPACGPKEAGYIAVRALRGEKDMAREAVVEEFSRAADYLRRAQNLAKALQLDNEVEGLVREVVAMRDRFAAPAEQSA